VLVQYLELLRGAYKSPVVVPTLFVFITVFVVFSSCLWWR